MNSILKHIIVMALIVIFLVASVSLEAKAKEQKVSGKASVSLRSARVSMQNDLPQKALGQLLDVLKLMPTHVYSLYWVGQLYYDMAETDVASVEDQIDTFKKAHEYFAKTISTIEGIADWKSYEEKGESFEVFRENASIGLENVYKLIFNVGKEMYDDGDIEVAEDIFKELLIIDSQKPQAYQMLAAVAAGRGDEEQKLDYLSRLGNVAKDNPNVLSLVAGEYLTAKDYPNAIHYYQMYIELMPEDATGYLSMGGVYWEMENFAEAYRYFQTALRLDPDNVDIVVNTLAMAQKTNDEANMLVYAKKWTELDENKESLGTLCILLFQNKDWQQFIEYGKKWHSSDPENVDIIQYIIYSAQQVKDTATENEYKEIQRKM